MMTGSGFQSERVTPSCQTSRLATDERLEDQPTPLPPAPPPHQY